MRWTKIADYHIFKFGHGNFILIFTMSFALCHNLRKPFPNVHHTLYKRMTHVLANTQTEQPHVPIFSHLLDIRVQFFGVHTSPSVMISSGIPLGNGGFDSWKDLGAAKVCLHALDVALCLFERAGGVRLGFCPEEGMGRAE